MAIDDDARWAGRLSIAYIMAVAAEVLRSTPADILDLLLLTTVTSMNVPPDGAPGTPVGVSRNVLSRTLNIPLETVRRRVAGLIEKKALKEQSDGLVFSPNNALGLGDNAQLRAFNLEKLRELFRGLKAAGIDLD